MKILVCDPIAREGIELLEKSGHEITVKTGMSPDELEETIPGFHAVIVRSATKVRKRHIDKATDLKVIARGGVGLDNIDVAYAREKGIKVLNTPGASSVSVAELTFGHMLAAARGLGRGTAGIKQGKWEKKKLKGIELNGKTLGLIGGAGRIAREVARRAVAFGMKVIAYDVVKVEVKDVEIEFVEMDELLSRSDFISLHVPLTEGTRNIIDREAIAKMKDGAIIINCGRGGTVDEEACAEALDSGKLRAVGFDVFSTEPVSGDESILSKDNVSFTPHIGASTVEGQLRVGIEVAQVVVDALK